jgi:uncharacterized membrane protein
MVKNWPYEWYSVIYEVSSEFLRGFLLSLPKILGGLIVFLVGWMFAAAVGKVVTEILNRLKFNEIFERTGWGEAFRRADLRVNLSEFFGAIIKWTLVFVSLLMVVQILGFVEFAVFLTGVLNFLPNLIVAILIFMVAVVLADIFQKVTVASVEKANVGYAKVAGLLVRVAIMVFAWLAIFIQLGIAKEMILILFQGIVAFFVIALGLSFGLGGKEVAADILRELKEKLR